MACSEITDIENIANQSLIKDEAKLKCWVNDLIKNMGDPKINPTAKDINKYMNQLKNKYKMTATKADLRFIYAKFYEATPINRNLFHYMIKKSCRSGAGVLVSTVVLRPDVFSCPKKCFYCPQETDLNGNPTQPKSYLSSEPAMLRALQYDFDIKGQFCDRVRAFIKTGNIQTSSPSKWEIIFSGGTWESYPIDYRDQVICEIYWAANTFNNERPMLSLEEEQKINETSMHRIIGLTLETRPDFITKTAIKNYRRYGCTRIQIGVQHYDDTILDKINRDCYTKDTINAIKLLKQTGFKVVCHLMPDLPGSSPELDKWMFDEAINNPNLQFDDVKVYPCAVCKSSDPNLIVTSVIAEWYHDGTYIPYGEQNLNKLIEVLKDYKKCVQKWVRIERLIRDIPKQSIEAGYEGISNLRQIIQDQMKKAGTKCYCIRCMEIRDRDQQIEAVHLVVSPYIASEGQEYFISSESHKKTIIWSKEWWYYMWFCFMYYITLIFIGQKTWWRGNLKTYDGIIGFCRLRIDRNPGGGIIRELKGCALIREVHVYGQSLGVGNSGASSQHKGYGQLLVKTAEEIAIQHGFTKIAVISGIGTREYYKNKCGYHLEGTYMIKDLLKEKNKYTEKENYLNLFWISIFIMVILTSTIYTLFYYL